MEKGCEQCSMANCVCSYLIAECVVGIAAEIAIQGTCRDDLSQCPVIFCMDWKVYLRFLMHDKKKVERTHAPPPSLSSTFPATHSHPSEHDSDHELFTRLIRSKFRQHSVCELAPLFQAEKDHQRTSIAKMSVPKHVNFLASNVFFGFAAGMALNVVFKCL